MVLKAIFTKSNEGVVTERVLNTENVIVQKTAGQKSGKKPILVKRVKEKLKFI